MTGLEKIVHFNKEFSSYKTLPDGKVQVDFADGTNAVGDLLVGADGAHSRGM